MSNVKEETYVRTRDRSTAKPEIAPQLRVTRAFFYRKQAVYIALTEGEDWQWNWVLSSNPHVHGNCKQHTETSLDNAHVAAKRSAMAEIRLLKLGDKK